MGGEGGEERGGRGTVAIIIVNKSKAFSTVPGIGYSSTQLILVKMS